MIGLSPRLRSAMPEALEIVSVEIFWRRM